MFRCSALRWCERNILVIFLAGTGLNVNGQVQEYVVMDFEDSELHDQAWFSTQSVGTVGFYVEPKSDSGADDLFLAIGQGRNGGNALLVQSTNSSMGLPGFWVLNGEAKAGWIANPTSDAGFVLPRGRKANRLSFWLRFDQGFRTNSSSAQPPSYPNHQNLHVGTYHYDPSRPGVRKESDNWHFYHMIFLRHDLAGTNWINEVLNAQPEHERSISPTPVFNPTSHAGDYWELLTRFYIDLHPYFGEPELTYPIRMWVDDICMYYEPDPEDISVRIEDFVPGQLFTMPAETTNSFVVHIENRSAHTVTGNVWATIPYWYNPILMQADGSGLPGTLTISPLSQTNFLLTVSPDNDQATGRVDDAGIQFVRLDQYQSGSNYLNRSFSSPWVEKRWFETGGTHDAEVYSTHMQLSIGNAPLNNQRPQVDGGKTLHTLQDQVLTRSLKASDPDWDPLTFSITQQDATNVTADSLSGSFTFVPTSGFTGLYWFTFIADDGIHHSNTGVVWIMVDPDSDGDGLHDAWEKALFGHLAYTADQDTDGDHVVNRNEYQAGTDPNDALVYPEIHASRSGSLISVRSQNMLPADGPGYEGRKRFFSVETANTTGLVCDSWTTSPGSETPSKPSSDSHKLGLSYETTLFRGTYRLQ